MAPKAKEKPKPSPPSQSQPSIPLEDLFSSLNRHTQSFEFEHAVKVADQILSIAPGDEDALRCKIVALIKSENIDLAFSTIKEFEGLPIDLKFYKAYCLYRQNKLLEALECLKGQEGNAAALQLESQILYRSGKMEACMESYEKLQKFKIDSFSLELKTNIVAALISAGRASEVQGMMDTLKVKATSSFELAYNTACSLIEKKKYADAEQLLLSARRIGQEMLMEDDYADDEIESELAPVSVQLAYVRQLLGRTQEAMEAYTDTLNRNLADASSFAVATNNLIALKGAKDVSDGLRKLDRIILKGGGPQGFQLAHGLDFKLSPRQKEAIYGNRLLLLLHTNKMDQARELAAALRDMFPDSVVSVMLQAAVLVRENKAGKAEEILGQFADRFPEKSKAALLACAQVAAAAGHAQIAAESLARIDDIQHMPATVATLVSLRERSGDITSAGAVLESAIQWWTNSMSKDNKLNLIMHEAASFKLKHGQEEEASRLYEELVKSHGSVEALVGLVTTAANVDVDKAEAYEKKLRALPGLREVNIESLEKTSGAKHVEGGHGKLVVEEAYEEGKGKTKARKKRKRKPRYPKGFDSVNPGPPPDPERWLPKRERSSFRPKRKDKRAAQVRGSQGAVVKEKHDLNAANASVSNASSSSKSSVEQSQPKPSSKSSRKKSKH
ncbi:SRP72 RNA-binding domain-containing protein [Tasmannia lanceolata]|uniref:SRP72 RNA-binding domain-containing protein n=1 Tax=Tasmannia lanceolata TaxID=3420 RepID=UPI004063D58F